MYASDEAWPTLGENETRPECISYLSFCPYINKPCMLTDFGQMGDAAILYHFFAPIGCILLLLLVTGKLKRKKKKIRKSGGGKAKQEDNGNMFCRNCGGKMAAGTAFCPHCGTKVLEERTDICANCGAVIPPGDAFCSRCGTAGRGEAAASSPVNLQAAGGGEQPAYGTCGIFGTLPIAGDSGCRAEKQKIWPEIHDISRSGAAGGLSLGRPAH